MTAWERIRDSRGRDRIRRAWAGSSYDDRQVGAPAVMGGPMRRNPRKHVIEVIVGTNLGPSAALYPDVAEALLECGHRVSLGVERDGQRYRPRLMACAACGAAAEAQKASRR